MQACTFDMWQSNYVYMYVDMYNVEAPYIIAPKIARGYILQRMYI